MAKKAKKKKHDEHIDESWLVPYADILTLLLALFIVLFASSSVDQEKLERLSAVFNQVFDGGTSFLEQPAPLPTPNPSEQTPQQQQQNSAYLKDQQELAEIKDSVDNFIAVNEMEGQFATEMTDEGLLVTIRDSILFDPGRATIKPEYNKIAAELAGVLVSDPARSIVITGHTDNVPQTGPEFASNWELSVMRAVNFLKILVDSNSNLDPVYFSAKGYGEYKAIAPNNTAEGRAKNRRVEVLIQPLVAEDGSAAKNTQ